MQGSLVEKLGGEVPEWHSWLGVVSAQVMIRVALGSVLSEESLCPSSTSQIYK